MMTVIKVEGVSVTVSKGNTRSTGSDYAAGDVVAMMQGGGINLHMSVFLPATENRSEEHGMSKARMTIDQAIALRAQLDEAITYFGGSPGVGGFVATGSKAGAMGAAGFTGAAFDAKIVPNGTELYIKRVK